MEEIDFLLVQFHRFEPNIGYPEQMLCERAAPWPHFQQLGKGILLQRINDFTAYVFVAQEMLAQ